MHQESSQNLLSLFGLAGRTAIVTGGARGIGRGIAETLGRAGARIVVGDLDGDAATATAEALGSTGIQAVGIQVDVAEEDSVKAFFDAVREHSGSVDVLVNNAAIFPRAPFMDISVRDWDRMHEINVRGTFLCMREAIRHMSTQGQGGSIVNISSVNS